jgi:hypothetical protein
MAAFSWTALLNILGSVLGPLLGAISPSIKDLLNGFMTDLYKKCLATPNPWDDFAVGLLLDVLGIPRPPPP